KAYVRGLREYHDARTRGVNREDVIAILQKHTALKDRALYDFVPWSARDPDARVNGGAIAAAQDWFVANGYVARPSDVSTIVDSRFADYAVAQLGPYNP